MLVRSRSAFDVLSISALDLFASSLGVFMLLSLMLFPYWLKQPALQAQTAAAEARTAAAAAAVAESERALARARDADVVAAAALARAQQRLAGAEDRAEAAEAKASAREAEAATASATQAQAQAEAEAAARARAATAKPVAAPRRTGISIDDLDLVFVMDATGSMRREMADVQANLLGIVRVLDRLSPSLRVGFVAYKDRGEEFVTRAYPLGPVGKAAGGVVGFVRDIRVGGGGDDPEPIDVALAEAVAMPWRSGVQGRIIVIGDAAVHAGNTLATLQTAQRFAASGGATAARRVGAIFTGENPADRAFFQRLAETGGGDFSEYQGAIAESVLLSVLDGAGGGR